MFRFTGVALLTLLLVGCAGEAEAPVEDAPEISSAEMQFAAGRVVYDDVCSACHSLQPPHLEAPPITHIARRIRSELDTRPEFMAHVTRHVANPSEEESLLPAHAIEKFGLMPGQNLSEEQLTNVAAWLWVMADSAQMGMDHEGGEMGEGHMGGGMGQGRMGEGGMGEGRMGEGHMGAGMGEGHRGGGMREGRMGGRMGAGPGATPPDTIG